MDFADPTIIKFLVTQGVLGLACLVEAWVIYRLWRDKDECEAGRLADAKGAIPIIEALKATMTAQLAATEARNRQADAVTDGLRALTEESRAGRAMQEQHVTRAFERLDRVEKALERARRDREEAQ